ncbi:MAG: glycosyltransferase family 2 protein [Opitutaceae bacterium]
MTTVSVLINTYNYGRFVAEAVESALAQVPAPTEIIVVDDGSTDDTRAVLATKFGNNPAVKVIHQRNAGQLAAFVTGFEHATGDLVLMLDADDTYAPGHVANVVRAFATHREVNFVFTAHRQFGEGQALVQRSPDDELLGFSLVGALVRTLWIGSVTSTLALRRPLVLTLLPTLRQVIPQWPIRADDCLVLGASLAGSQKYFLAEPTVNYRVHGANHFHQRESGAADHYAHWLRREGFKSILAGHLGIPREVIGQVDREFSTLPRPTRREYQEYVAIVWSLRVSLWTKVTKRLRLYAHFRSTQRPQTSRHLPGTPG